MTTKINYSCGLDNNILEKVKKITNMVYKIVEIKYTVQYFMLCNFELKRQTLCTQAKAIKSKFLKISKMDFLFFYLLLVDLCLYLGN